MNLRGKEPARMVMGAPLRTEQREDMGRQRDAAIFETLGLADNKHHAGTINLRNLEPDAFRNTQAAGVNGR